MMFLYIIFFSFTSQETQQESSLFKKVAEKIVKKAVTGVTVKGVHDLIAWWNGDSQKSPTQREDSSFSDSPQSEKEVDLTLTGSCRTNIHFFKSPCGENNLCFAEQQCSQASLTALCPASTCLESNTLSDKLSACASSTAISFSGEQTKPFRSNDLKSVQKR